MTVSSTTNIAGPFDGNDVTTNFPFTFKVFDAAHLTVYHTDALDVETVVDPGDYTVNLNADQELNPGGSIDYPNVGSPLATGEKLTIERTVPKTQAVDLVNQGAWLPDVVERALDWLTMITHQLQDKLDRTPSVPVSGGVTDISLPLPNEGKGLIWDATGDLVNSDDNINGIVAAASASAAAALASENAAAISETNAAASETLAQQWAVLLDALVDATDYSSKEWAIGTTVAAGSAKDWATQLTTTVDGAEYSAKEYAYGSPPLGSAREWASRDGLRIDGVDFGAKEWAVGSSSDLGSAKEWAQNTGAEVRAGEGYSAREWAEGVYVPAGSAKAWATEVEDTLVDGVDYSSKHYAAKSAASAAAAAVSASQGMFADVVDVSTSPYNITEAQGGDLIRVTTTAGTRTINLPLLSSLAEDDMRVAVCKFTGDANTVQVLRQGTDTINGGTSLTIDDQYEQYVFIGDKATGEWIASGGLATGITGGDGIDVSGGVIAVDLDTTSYLEFNAGKLRCNVGTTATEVAAGNHLHAGVYEPADADILKADVTDALTVGFTTTIDAESFAASYTPDMTTQHLRTMTVTGNITINAASASGSFKMLLTADASGPYTVSFGSNVYHTDTCITALLASRSYELVYTDYGTYSVVDIAEVTV